MSEKGSESDERLKGRRTRGKLPHRFQDFEMGTFDSDKMEPSRRSTSNREQSVQSSTHVNAVVPSRSHRSQRTTSSHAQQQLLEADLRAREETAKLQEQLDALDMEEASAKARAEGEIRAAKIQCAKNKLAREQALIDLKLTLAKTRIEEDDMTYLSGSNRSDASPPRDKTTDSVTKVNLWKQENQKRSSIVSVQNEGKAETMNEKKKRQGSDSSSPASSAHSRNSELEKLTIALTHGLQGMSKDFIRALKEIKVPAREERLSGDMDHKKLMARKSIRDLPTFSGEFKEWPLFIAEYKRTTELCGFSAAENISRLHKCLKGKAKEIVLDMLVSPDNLDRAIATLERNFGRPDHIIRAMVEKAQSSPVIKEGNLEGIMDLSNCVRALVSTMKTLQETGHMLNPQLMGELVSKLPNMFKYEWGKLVMEKPKSSLEDLSEWLEKCATAAGYIYATKSTAIEKTPGRAQEKGAWRSNSQQQKGSHRRQTVFATVDESGKAQSTKTALTIASTPKPRADKTKEKLIQKDKCTFCDIAGHHIQKCRSFLKESLEDRRMLVRDCGLCYSCLGLGHTAKYCKEKNQCGKGGCTKKHHSSLHEGILKEEEVVEIVGHTIGFSQEVLYRVACVTLQGPLGKVTTWALFDEGSSLTLMETATAKRLGLKGEKLPLKMKYIDQSTGIDEESEVVSLKIQGKRMSTAFQLSGVRTVEKLGLPHHSIDRKRLSKDWAHLKGVDFESISGARPSILIGLDNFDLIVPTKAVSGPKNAPIATFCKLGWTISGNSGQLRARVDGEFTFHVLHSEEEESLHQLVKESFRAEAIGIKVGVDQLKSKEDLRYQLISDSTTKRVGDRWETGLPWKEDKTKLPESKNAALNRLMGLEKKMDRDSELACLYCEKIDMYIQKGYARKLTAEELGKANKRVWYLPHFAATNPNKPGKMRLVFDAAARVNGVGLNDTLLQGPDLLNSLVSVLYQFRQRQVAFSADIREMFHQVKIRDEDTAAQRFLWRGMDRKREPEVYQMDVMIFGAVSSPCQAQEVKNRNAKEFEEGFPEAAKAIISRHYVDDYLDSSDSIEEAIRRIKDVCYVHKKGGFEIVNWLCSSKEVLKQLPTELRADGGKEWKTYSESLVERVLGLSWNPEQDCFVFIPKFNKVHADITSGLKRPTKREVLRLVMSLFDPLGLLAHFTIKAKILLQEVWRSGIGWDDELPSSLYEKWKKWVKELQRIDQVRIPRCYAQGMAQAKNIELHVFGDASEKAYAAVAYLRTETEKEVEVSFVMARTRVSPLRPISIPRLELQASLMGSRLADHIVKEHEIEIKTCHFWTDSSTVIKWLRSDARRYKPFVAHRIGEIDELTDIENWHWLPTKLNVADEATRDDKLSNLHENSRWYKGPDFLRLPSSEWPTEKLGDMKEPREEDLEVKKDSTCFILSSQKSDESIMDVNKFSNWNRLTRATCYVFRFINLCRKKTTSREEFTVEELNQAKEYWIKRVQAESFGEDIQFLIKGKSIPKSSCLYQLSPMMKEGILVVRGRLPESTEIKEAMRRPPILDPKHRWTRLLIHNHHVRAGHHGREKVLNDLRQNYWILNMRSAVRRAWNACQECKNQRAKPQPPEMGELPTVRTSRVQRAFINAGLDYFGPMEVTIGRRHEKRYGALFSCLSTRAVHVELAASLSTDSAIMAIRRFIGRRGCPKTIHSDNGTNFHGAERELKEALEKLDQSRIHSELALKGVEWHFIPPSAPHMGGSWERLVQCVKKALKATLGNQRVPKEEVLNTLLVEAENIVNSRPLTPVSDDSYDQESITPNHLLIGPPLEDSALGLYNDKDLILRKQWKISQRLADIFWQRWVKEYLPTLVKRSKWHMRKQAAKIGDLVLIGDGDSPRNTWPRGVIVATFPGRDGQIRVVDVKTRSGIFRRPVVKLCILDVDKEVDVPPEASTGGSMSSREHRGSESDI